MVDSYVDFHIPIFRVFLIQGWSSVVFWQESKMTQIAFKNWDGMVLISINWGRTFIWWVIHYFGLSFPDLSLYSYEGISMTIYLFKISENHIYKSSSYLKRFYAIHFKHLKLILNIRVSVFTGIWIFQLSWLTLMHFPENIYLWSFID